MARFSMHSRPVSRVVFGSAVIALLVAIAGVARSQATEELTGASDTVLEYARALHAEHVDELRVNGLAFKVASGTTTDALGVVLDRFASACGNENADVRAEMGALPRGILERVRFDGTVRTERAGRGAVACLGRSAGTGQGTLAMRLRRFLSSGDVAAIGPIRLFFASGAAGRTTYVALTSEGTLPLRRAFPARGDAPGRDPDGLPRPAGAVRRVSAWAPGSTASVAVYETPETDPSAVLSSYGSALHAAGFEVNAATASAGHVVARRGTRAVLATVTRADEGGALVTIVGL